MGFLKRLLGGERKEKPAPPKMQGGISAEQALAEHEAQGETRKRMEAELETDRDRRGGTDERPTDTA
jgi:predicted phage-related endonuclease